MEHNQFPQIISLQTTSTCNGKCLYCPFTYKDFPVLKRKQKMNVMGDELYKKIIDECAESKITNRIILYLFNEPLTDPKFIERIKYINKKAPHIDVEFSTNGLLLSKKLIDELADCQVDSVWLNVPSLNPNLYEKLMGHKMNNLLENIDYLKEKTPHFQEHKVVVNSIKNFKCYEHYYWKSRGFVYAYMNTTNRAGLVDNEYIDQREYNKKKIIGCAWKREKDFFHIIDTGQCVTCCMDYNMEIDLGDVSKNSIREIFNGEKFIKFQQLVKGEIPSPDDFICKRCNISYGHPYELKYIELMYRLRPLYYGARFRLKQFFGLCEEKPISKEDIRP